MPGVEYLGDDHGAQPQRTMLAWHRTVIATVLGCATVALTAQRQQLPVVAVLAAIGTVVLVLLVRALPRWSASGVHRYQLIMLAASAVGALALLGTVVALYGVVT